MGLVIFDGKGYFVRFRRNRETGAKFSLWSPHKKDAFVFSMPEAAGRTVTEFPQKVKLLPV